MPGQARQARRFRWLLWLLLALPALYWLYGYWRGSVFYGEFLHASGDLSVQLLIVTLAITPLRLMFPRARWPRWLLARRRYLGVASFGYAVLHTGVYIQRNPAFGELLEDALGLPVGSGWLALILMLALAVTSNDASVRLLRGAWKKLHRLVYPAAALALVHWILTAFDPVNACIHLGVLAALEAFRLWKQRALLIPRRHIP